MAASVFPSWKNASTLVPWCHMMTFKSKQLQFESMQDGTTFVDFSLGLANGTRFLWGYDFKSWTPASSPLFVMAFFTLDSPRIVLILFVRLLTWCIHEYLVMSLTYNISILVPCWMPTTSHIHCWRCSDWWIRHITPLHWLKYPRLTSFSKPCGHHLNNPGPQSLNVSYSLRDYPQLKKRLHLWSVAFALFTPPLHQSYRNIWLPFTPGLGWWSKALTLPRTLFMVRLLAVTVIRLLELAKFQNAQTIQCLQHCLLEACKYFRWCRDALGSGFAYWVDGWSHSSCRPSCKSPGFCHRSWLW